MTNDKTNNKIYEEQVKELFDKPRNSSKCIWYLKCNYPLVLRKSTGLQICADYRTIHKKNLEHYAARKYQIKEYTLRYRKKIESSKKKFIAAYLAKNREELKAKRKELKAKRKEYHSKYKEKLKTRNLLLGGHRYK